MNYLNIPASQAAILITAVQDAIRYRESFLESETVEDVTEYEVHLLNLERLAETLREAYLRLRKTDPELPEFTALVPQQENGS